MKFSTDELRALHIFEGLPEEALTWLRDHGGDRSFVCTFSVFGREV
jgi:hypothetical protein